jgi:hypothetical protein
MSDSNIMTNWLTPEKTPAEDDVEYFVLTEDDCFYTAFFNPLGFDGWRDIASDHHLEVVLYHALPDAETLINTYK